MKIYFIARSLNDGGEAVFINNLLFYLKKRSFSIKGMSINRKKYFTKIISENSPSQHFIYGLKSLFIFFKFYTKNRNIISTFHNNLFPTLIYKRIPYEIRNLLILNLVAIFSKKIILLTEQQRLKFRKKILFKSIFDKKSVVINNFIEKEYILKSRKNYSNSVLFVGRYTKEKGIFDLLSLAEKILEINFNLIGTGEIEQKSKNVNNIGPISYFNIFKYYDKSSIFILPSYTEVFPITILEAMARGLVILVSDLPGMREIIKEGRNGYLFPPGDVKKMKEIILYLKNNPKEIERISKNNLRDIWKFTVEKQAPKYIKVYEEVLKESKKNGKNKYHQHKETIHNFIWRVLQTFGKSLATFLIFILCVKLLTPYDFGIYNYALAIVVFLIIFGDFGISTATSKYVAEYNVTDKNKLKSVLFNSGIIILGLTIIISILILLIGPSYLKEKYVYFLFILPLIFLAPMTSLYDGIYRGLKQFKKLAIISLIVGLISLSFVYILIKTYGLIGALISQDLFYVILLLALGFSYKEFHFKWNKEVMKEVGGYSLLVGVADLGIFLYIQFDIIVLGWFNYINEIAYLSLANKIFMFLAIPFAIFSQIVAPNITSLYVHKKYGDINKKLKKYFCYSFLFGILIAIISFILIKPITILFLSQYDNYYFYLFFGLLLIIFPIRVFGSILATSFIVGTGQAKIMTYNNLIFGILNVVMDIIFIYVFGFIGVIFSTLILGYISVLVAYYYFNKNINNKISK